MKYISSIAAVANVIRRESYVPHKIHTILVFWFVPTAHFIYTVRRGNERDVAATQMPLNWKSPIPNLLFFSNTNTSTSGAATENTIANACSGDQDFGM